MNKVVCHHCEKSFELNEEVIRLDHSTGAYECITCIPLTMIEAFYLTMFNYFDDIINSIKEIPYLLDFEVSE